MLKMVGKLAGKVVHRTAFDRSDCKPMTKTLSNLGQDWEFRGAFDKKKRNHGTTQSQKTVKPFQIVLIIRNTSAFRKGLFRQLESEGIIGNNRQKLDDFSNRDDLYRSTVRRLPSAPSTAPSVGRLIVGQYLTLRKKAKRQNLLSKCQSNAVSQYIFNTFPFCRGLVN